MICIICGQEGHNSEDCPIGPRDSDPIMDAVRAEMARDDAQSGDEYLAGISKRWPSFDERTTRKPPETTPQAVKLAMSPAYGKVGNPQNVTGRFIVVADSPELARNPFYQLAQALWKGGEDGEVIAQQLAIATAYIISEGKTGEDGDDAGIIAEFARFIIEGN